MNTLTVRQAQVLRFVYDAIESTGIPPSIREIGEAVGLTSTSSVAYQLGELQAKGYIAVDPNRPRGLTITVPAALAGVTTQGDHS